MYSLPVMMEMTCCISGEGGKKEKVFDGFYSTSTSCSMLHISTAEQKSTESIWEPHLCCEIFSSGDLISWRWAGYRREDSGSVHSLLLVVQLFSHWVGNRK